MNLSERLEKAWAEHGRFQHTHRSLTFTENGLELGNGIVIAKATHDDWGRPALAIGGQEERILALMSAAWNQPMPDWIIEKLHGANQAFSKGERALAYIHIAHIGLWPLEPNPETFRRLFLADGFLKAGINGNELRKAWGLGRSDFHKENPNVCEQPRDDHGCWTTGGNSNSKTKDQPQSQGKRSYKVGDMMTGNASFYGNNDPKQGPTDNFAGKKTASGQTMDPSAMTAAVLPFSVPLGATVRVAMDGNPTRSVEVMVNDHGLYSGKKDGQYVPIPGNRVIDLSPAAYRQLTGGLSSGTTKVTVTIVKLPKGTSN